MALPWYAVLGLLVLALWMIRHKRAYLRGLDSMFVSGDPHNVIVVHGVCTTKTPINMVAFRRLVDTKMACHMRFRQRIVKRVWRWHYFQTDENSFHLDHHLRTHSLETNSQDPVALQDSLERYVSEMIQTPLDFSRPPWEVVVIPQYGGGSAVLLRVHHAIADGITLLRIAMGAFERADGGGAVEAGSPGMNQSPSPSPEPSFTTYSGFQAKRKYKKVRMAGPKTVLAKAWAAFRAGWRLLTMRQDKPGLLKASTNITPQIPVNARWLSTPLSLAELKQLSYATGCSVNDVLFSLVSGALRQYCLRHGQAASTIEDVHTIMWVSLQGTELVVPVTSFGNHIGAVVLPLPVSEPDDLVRLRRVCDMTNAAQVSPEPYVAAGLLQLVGVIPNILMKPVWDWLAFRCTGSMSNVPGPSYPVTFGVNGAELDRLVFFVPPQGTISSFITILSLNGAVQLGFLADSRVVSNPREVLDLCLSEYDKLKRTVDDLQNKGQLAQRLGLSEQE